MSYSLGIDVGTTYTGVAVARDGRAEIFPLGHDRPTAPTIVVVRETGEILVGDAAERRAATEPGRVAREFKRRVGDPAPIIVGGTPYGVDALFGHVLHWAYAQVVEQEGGAPAAITLTHPASWAGFKQDILRQAAHLGGLPPVELLSEPQAAALRYAAEGKVDPGDVVAVYDFGGGTFDAALVRSSSSGFELVGEAEGMERLGGLDFDQAVFAHVDQSLDGMLQGLDTSDTAVRAGLVQLRTECRLAKEVLSTDTDTLIPVLVPGIETEVRLTRTEFEAMIRPRIVETVEAVRRTLRSASLEADAVASILLVGGSSRIPLVAQVLHEELGRPVVLDSHPKFTIALGAASQPWRNGSLAVSAVAGSEPAVIDEASSEVVEEPIVPVAPPSPTEPVVAAPASSPSSRPAWLVPSLIGAAVVAVVLGVVAALGLGGGSSNESSSMTPVTDVQPSAAPPTTSASAPATAEVTAATSPPSSMTAATTTPSADTAPSTDFVQATSFDGVLTVDVPVAWTDIDTSPFVVVATPTAHVSASPNLAAYLDSWIEPGLTVALVDPFEGGSVDELMAAVGGAFGYDVDCEGGVPMPYDDGRVVGLQTDWLNCADTSTTIRVVVGLVDDDPGWLLLAGLQAPDPADLPVLDRVLDTVQIAS